MSNEPINPLELQLSTVCFTNDKSMFCICHNQGFLVCKVSPFAILNNRILGGDISIAQMLDMSNIIFLASGGGEHPKYSPTNLIMFDDHKGKPVAQLQIGHRIKNIKANSKKLFVVGKSKVFLFNTEDLSNVGTFESYEENEEGICSLAPNSNDCITFAYPAKIEGFVNIMRIKGKIIDIRSFYTYNKKIACIELNKNGGKLLTSSITGTLIRLFDTQNGNIIDDFKRGNDIAQIFSLSFSHDDKFVCCSSDKGTIHIFKRNEFERNEINEINRVERRPAKNILDKEVENKNIDLLKSRKFAFCRTNEESSFCVFSEKYTIHMVSVHEGGKFCKINFDQNQGGETKIEEAFNILCQENLPHLGA